MTLTKINETEGKLFREGPCIDIHFIFDYYPLTEKK